MRVTCTEGVHGAPIKQSIHDISYRFFFSPSAQRDDTEGIPDNLQLFDIFCDEATRIIEARTDMPLQHALALYVRVYCVN